MLIKGKKVKAINMKKSKRKMCYHGRCGYPFIHESKTYKKYIMVRKRGGGTKRLYLVKGNVPLKDR